MKAEDPRARALGSTGGSGMIWPGQCRDLLISTDGKTVAEAPSSEAIAGATRGWSRWDGPACLACVVVGLLLAVAPHLASLASRGTLDYLADSDDVLYLTIARAPYYGEFAVRDPFARKSDHMPTLYSWAQFVPFTLPARWLGVRPLLIALVWRILGGILLGGSLYVLFRRLVRETRAPSAWALGLSLICLSDAGFVDGRSLVANYGLFWHMLHSSTPMGKADALGQYRVVTPLLNLPFLLLVVAAVVPSPGRWRAWSLLGALCLGLCFHLYFFYWTAAVAALAASAVVGFVFYRRDVGRWASVRPTVLVLLGGMALGLPQVYANARTYSNPEIRPILERMGRGRVLDRNDPVRTRYLLNSWAWGKLAVGALAILAFRLKGLGPVWWLTFFGFSLANSALVTGLEFENFHWVYVHAPMGEILILVIAARLLDRWNPGRAIRNRLLWVVPAVLLAVAANWRPYEALHASEPLELAEALKAFRGLEPTLARLGPDEILAGHPWSRLAALFSRCGLLFQEPHSYLSSVLSEESVHERSALNFWLRGLPRESYRAENREYPFLVVPSGDTSRWSPESASRRREAIFEEIEADQGSGLMTRYRPDAVLLNRGYPPGNRGGPWRYLGMNSSWWIRVRDPEPPEPPTHEKIDSTNTSASKG